MRDPIEELSSFDPGVPVNPLPAPEVRRRGERLRRRNTTAIVVGAVAAVLAVAIPIAVFADGDEGGGRLEPADRLTTGALLTADEVPARARLTDWRETPSEGEVLACAPPQNSLSDGADDSVRRDFAADAAGLPTGEDPIAVVKTSVLQFSDETAARDAYDRAQGWILGCPGAADLAVRGVSIADVDIVGGRGEWRRHDIFATDVCTDCDAIRFDRMGVAHFGDRLVLVSLAEVGGPLQPKGLDASMEELIRAAVTKAGGVITGASGSGEETVSPGPEPAEPTPAEAAPALDFPLDTGLISGSEFTVEGPRAGVEGVTFPEGFCGTDVWPPSTPLEGRLALKVTGPEYGQWRELVTFPSADEAVAAMAAIREAVETCPEVRGDEPASDLTFVSHPVDSGYDDATFSYTYREGLGGTVYQFVRVGHAVLATAQAGEWAPETTPEGARQLNGENSQLTPLMCEYTEAGC